MKAWIAHNKTYDKENITIVFAETAGKAKSVATKTAACEGSRFTDISVKRLPTADKMYKAGQSEMDWNDKKNRIFLKMVQYCGFSYL